MKWFTLTDNFFYLKCIEFPSLTPIQSTIGSPNSLGFFFSFFFSPPHILLTVVAHLVFHYKFIYLFFSFFFSLPHVLLWSLVTCFLIVLSSECTKTRKRDRHTLRIKWRRCRGCRNRGRRNKGKEEEMHSRVKYEEEEEKPR